LGWDTERPGTIRGWYVLHCLGRPIGSLERLGAHTKPDEVRILKAIQLVQEIDEFSKLVKAAKCQTALEIGAAQCGTAVILGEAMGHTGRIVSADLPVDKGGTSEAHEREAKGHLGGRFTLVRGDALAFSTIEAVKTALNGRKVDVLLIDAGHTEAEAMGEYAIYRTFLADLGMAAFHDICYELLWPMWNRLRGERPPNRSVEIINDVTQKDCGIGVLLGK